jgi:YD repeat-containing protein
MATDPASNTTAWTYNTLDLPATVTDAAGRVATAPTMRWAAGRARRTRRAGRSRLPASPGSSPLKIVTTLDDGFCHELPRGILM